MNDNMLQDIFVKEYFKNPFLWWGVFMFIFTIFSASLILNHVMRDVVVYQWYAPFLFSSVAIVLSLSLYPIRRSLRKLFEKKETKLEATVFLAAVCILFFTEVVYFMSDPPLIFNTLSPGMIKDKNVLNYAVNVKTLAQFIALPLLSAFTFTNIKSKLVKEDLDIHDKFGNNLKFMAYTAIISLSMYLVSMFIFSLK